MAMSRLDGPEDPVSLCRCILEQAREVSAAADVWRCLMTIIILGG